MIVGRYAEQMSKCALNKGMPKTTLFRVRLPKHVANDAWVKTAKCHAIPKHAIKDAFLVIVKQFAPKR